MPSTVKAYKGMGMEGPIARWYDRTTRRDMDQFRALAARIAALVPAGAKVLEVAPGPGFLSIELARRGLRVQAVEISHTFVRIAQENAAAESAPVTFLQGDASHLPLPAASVDFVVCRAAFKNFSEPVKAMAEMRRVLRPGGTALLIDMHRDVKPEELREYVHGMRVNWLNRLFIMGTFRFMLIPRAYPLAEIRRMADEAGWSDMRIDVSAVGFEARTSVPGHLPG